MADVSYTIDELLATRFTNKYIVGFDFSGLVKCMTDDLNVWNSQMNDLLSLYCETTNKQQMNTGSSDESGDFVPLDRIGKAGSGVVLPGNTMGWPLRRFGKGINTDRFWQYEKTPYDVLMAQRDIEINHRQRVISEIRKAMFYNVNYSFTDRYYDNLVLPVKAAYNLDLTWNVPMCPDGTVYALGAHNHYLGTAALAAADVDGLVNTVAEHQQSADGIEIHIPLTSKAAFTALAGFQKVQPVQFYQNIDVTTNVVAGQLDNSAHLNDQYIGIWDSSSSAVAKVFVKPWCLTGYIVALATQSPNKPLMKRIHPDTRLSGLRLWGKTNDGSLFNDQYEDIVGFGVYDRSAIAVLYTGGAAYVSPITAAQLEA